MIRARKYLVEGRVQGVGFRYFVLRKAEDRRLTGWARNLPDGRVEVLAEGTPESLDGLEQDLRRGPRMAGVTAVQVTEVAPESRESGFRIRG